MLLVTMKMNVGKRLAGKDSPEWFENHQMAAVI